MGLIPISQREARPVDPVLTNYALEYGNKLSQYQAKKAISVVNTFGQATGTYAIWDKETQFANRGYGHRASNGKLDRLEFSRTNGTFSCQPHGFGISVTDRDQRTYQGPEDWQTIKSRFLKKAQLDALERSVAAAYNPDNMTYTVTASGTTQWSHASSLPFDMIKTAINSVRLYSGNTPNFFLCPFNVALTLLSHASFVARFSGWTSTVRDIVLPDPFFGMTPIILGTSTNSANINQTGVLADLWGKHAWFLYLEPVADKESLTFASLFEEFDDGLRTYRDEEIAGDVIEIERSDDVKIVAQGAGYAIKNVIA